LYHALGGGLASLALSCLVQLASVRRSLFSNNERAKFLNRLASGGLSDPTNYHEFCRLLARLKSNYQLGELVMVDNYPALIAQIAKFTQQSLQEFCRLLARLKSNYQLGELVMGDNYPALIAQIAKFMQQSLQEFCRLLARLKSNYQLGELVMVDNYPALIAQIAKFTQQSLREFCRLLARLKSNYQLGELVMVDNYSALIAQIAKFTQQSLRVTSASSAACSAPQVQLPAGRAGDGRQLPYADRADRQMWQFAPNSVHYLLSLWQRMVASVPYVKATEPHLLETDGLEDPLDDVGTVQQQLDQLSVIARCEYANTCQLLVAHFDRAAHAYSIETQSRQIMVLQGTTNDAMDGELVCRVLQLMDLTDTRLAQVQKNSKVYRRLSEVLGLNDESRLLSVLIRKIITNLKYWGSSEQIISKTLGLLSELSGGYSCVRKLVKLEEVQFMLTHHTAEHFPFLGITGVGTCEMRCRTMLYTALGRLLMVELGEDEERFHQFMMPLTGNYSFIEHFPFLGITGVGTCEMRCRTMLYTAGGMIMVELGEDEERFHQFAWGHARCGVSPCCTRLGECSWWSWERTRNGSTSSCCHLPRHFPFLGITGVGTCEMRCRTMLYTAGGLLMVELGEDEERFHQYPVYMKILLRGVELWYSTPAVSTPVLKLTAELAQNRNQRLHFDVSSPNGILLFRELSNIICAYGSRILTVEVNKKQMYAMKLKGISLCFSILKAALCGNYANFGVFRLAQDHMPYLASLQPEATLYILCSISEGLTALASNKVPNPRHAPPEISNMFIEVLQRRPEIMQQLLATVSMNPRHAPPEISNMFIEVLQRRPEIMQQLLATVSMNPRHAPPEISNMFIEVLQRRPEIMQQLLATPAPRAEIINMFIEVLQRRPEIMQQLLATWSMSRPLLGLILLNEESFARLRQQLLASQPRDKQPQLATWFTSLMQGVEPNLLTKNRDRFTQNLSMFRRDINDLLKGTTANAAPNVNDMM
ncbi:Uncharacterized protein OBRU01_15791, partial [Operophtera brumata]